MLTGPTGRSRERLPGVLEAAAREDRFARLVAARTSARDRRFGMAEAAAATDGSRASLAPVVELETPVSSVRATGLRRLLARLRRQP